MFVVTSFTCCSTASMMFSIIFLLVVLVYNSDADIQNTGSQMVVKQVKVLKCSSDLLLSRYPGHMVAYQEWNQVYVGESGSEYVISHLGPIMALQTMFTVELEKFDNNTDIYSSFRVHNASNSFKPVMNFTMHCSGTDRKLISLVDDGFYQYKIDSTLIYDDTKIVKFSCQENAPVNYNRTLPQSGGQVAWINSAGDRIYPYNEPVITLNATEVHNASMLCCVYYLVTDERDVKTVQRFVTNKTLLIYRKGMANDGVQPSGTINSKTSKDLSKSNTINETGKDLSTAIKETGRDLSTTVNETGKDLSTTINGTGKNRTTIIEIGKDLSTTINETGKDLSTTINGTGQNPNVSPDKISGSTTSSADSNDHVSDAQTTNYNIVIISSISVLVLILLVSIVTIKTRCWKKNDRLERPRAPCQLPPNEPPSHMPFYVNMLFRRECDQEIRVREEPHYEEIMYQ